MTVIEPELRFFQMQVEGVPGYPIELHHPSLCIAPKAFNAVNMNRASGEFIVAMIDSQVFVKAHINQAIVATPTICMDDAGNVGFASNDGLQRAFGGIWHDLRVDAVAPLEQTEYNCFSTCSAPTQSAYAAGAKIRFIRFELAAQAARFSRTVRPSAVSGVGRWH